MADEMIKKPETVWKRLTRLFRSGPVIRHKVVGGEIQHEPRGTASQFKKEVSSLYVHSLASYGQAERHSRLADYQEMDIATPEVASALNILADESTTNNENGEVLNIITKNAEIKEVLEVLFYEIINIDFNLWSWVRNLCKAGDMFMLVDASEHNGVLNLLPIPVNEIEREEGYDKKDPFAVRFRWITQGNQILQNWQMIHMRLLGNDSFLPYGQSTLESARRIWRQLILVEDAMLVYRIVRSPERRVFYVDVGNIAPDQVDQFMEQIKTRLRRNQVVDPMSGRVDLRYNPLSVDEDFWIPTRGDKSTRIETLPGGQFIGDIEDVKYIQAKLFSALMVPKAYLGYDEGIGSKSLLSQEDVRFSRTIGRIQKIIVSELNKIAIIHLFLLGYSGSDLVDFELRLNNPSTIAEQQKLELWRMKLEVAGSAQEGIFDKETIWRKIFGFTDEEIQKIREGRRFDKLDELSLEAITLDEPVPAEGEALPGEEELPQTLGGDEGQIEEPEGEKPPEEAFGITGPVISEKGKRRPNKGSTGNDASLAVDKGKDLFSTGEDQFTAVFGTEKQTASDPYDLRALSRLISRPFSESKKRTKAKRDPRKGRTIPGKRNRLVEKSEIDETEELVEEIVREASKMKV